MADKVVWRKRLVKAPDDLWNSLKAQAALEHRALFAVLGTAIREYLVAQKKRPARSA